MDNNEKIVGVPKQVFEKFLEDLKDQNVANDVIDRLRKAIIQDGNLTDVVLRKAMLPKE